MENHPIERFWNEYKRKREEAEEQRKESGHIADSFDPNSVSPASGLDNVNLSGKYNS